MNDADMSGAGKADTDRIDTAKAHPANNGTTHTMTDRKNWTVYRTRFLVQARQLSDPLSFTDVLGREQHGQPGDYLVESSDGFRRIAPRAIFEDIYVPLAASENGAPRKAPESEAPPRVAGAGRVAASACQRTLGRHTREDRSSAHAWTG
jgi:hypothetical protein